MDVYGDLEEQQLLANASSLIKSANAQTQAGSYLGIAYEKYFSHDSEKATNHFTLIGPDGNVVWNYLKVGTLELAISQSLRGASPQTHISDV